MTTEPPGMHEQPPVPEPAPEPVAAPLGNVSGRTLLLLASALIVGEYLVFSLIAEEWYPGEVSLVAATLLLFVGLVTPSRVDTTSMMRVGGYVIAAAGVWNFIEGIRYGWGGALDVIAWIILGLAAVLAFVGARSLDG